MAVAEAHNGVIAASKSELGGLEIRLHLPLEIKPFLKDPFTVDSVPI